MPNITQVFVCSGNFYVQDCTATFFTGELELAEIKFLVEMTLCQFNAAARGGGVVVLLEFTEYSDSSLSLH